ncbi:MAG: major facilitator superfamily 1, partial [Geminicoccaceae bacterium]|nr:major facilitator superfamily 1 [Geminicoccaceae bacterium]
MTATPAWWPRRWYYGWALVITLGVTATVSYGILSYGFAVFITPMGQELGWSKAQITGAFSISQLVLGVSAIPLGRWVDRRGARVLMTAGSVLATILLVAWSRVQSLEAFYLIWAIMGVALAAVLYEPAFAVVATWFRDGRGRALTLLTFIGGFASVIFVPLTTALVSRFGWRSALVWLAA